MKTALLLSVHFSLLVFVSCYGGNGYDPLENALAIQRSRGSVLNAVSNEDHSAENSNSPVYLAPQHGLKDADKISSLPGEPAGTDFDQYSGYVTVDPKHGRALFYYLAESPVNSSANPLVLWLNGGPGCSSFGNGAMMELGPFRVNPDNTTLSRNKYAWNNVANVLFLDSPAGVGFSYSNTSSDYETGDKQTAKDTYTFLINWLERFPEYKTRDFYIAGESYAGHYVPQLAQLVLQNNKITNQTVIKLKGIAIGNAYIDQETQNTGMFDYFWTHAIISDEIYEGIISNCNFSNGANITDACINYQYQAFVAKSNIFFYDIYAPLCTPFSNSTPSISGFDPCTENYVLEYLNTPVVQQSLHAKPVQWEFCNLLVFVSCYGGNGYDPLENTLKIQRLRRMTMNHASQQDANFEYSYSPVYVGPQDEFKDADKISELPGQPAGTDFYQYSGYVTVDPSHGKALFYYLAESPVNSSTNPLVLWLNGGPGCSSFGNGAMMELGPFRVNADNATLNTPAVQQALYAKPVEWESWFI